MSKLKRKKSVVEESKLFPILQSRDKSERPLVFDTNLHTRDGAGSSWWMRDDLSKEDRLGLIGLKELCPEIFDEDSNLRVPKLPESPATGDGGQKLDWHSYGCRCENEDVKGPPVVSSALPFTPCLPTECTRYPSTISHLHLDLQSHCSASPIQSSPCTTYHQRQHQSQNMVYRHTATKRKSGSVNPTGSESDVITEQPDTSALRSELKSNTGVKPGSESANQTCDIAGSSRWMRDDLSREKSLWLISLKEFCPDIFGEESKLCVATLPEFPATGDGGQKVTNWCWCGCRCVNEDVKGLPVVSSPRPLTPSIPTECTSHPSTVSLHHPDQWSHSSSIHSPPCSTFHQDQQPSQSVVTEYRHTAKKRKCSSVQPTGSECDATAESPETSAIRSEIKANTGVKPGSGVKVLKLDCCPMCLMAFPTGYSQMQCDEHLAQCLSALNEDVTW